MATAKVGAHPLSSARIRSAPSSRKSRLNGMHSVVAKSSNLQLPNYSIFQTPSNHSPLCLNGGTGGVCNCFVCVQCQGSAKAVHHGLFSFFCSLQQSGHQTNWAGSGNTTTNNPSCTDIKYLGPQLLIMPACSHYDVKRNGQSQNCAAYSQTQGACELTGFSVGETTPEAVNNAGTALLPGTVGGSRKCSDIISGSHDDETLDDNSSIHIGNKDIHADECSDTCSEYCSDLECCGGGEDDDDKEQGHAAQSDTAVSSSIPSKPTNPSVQVNSKANLSVNHLQLNKLLSDESGYYENISADFAASPCEWSQKAVVLTAEDIEEWEWDDECTDEEGEADEAADILWKSFEDCMLSPQTLNTKAADTKTMTADSPADVLTGHARNERVMQFEGDCHTTRPCKDSHPNHDSHVQKHGPSTSHMGTPCPPVMASMVSPCRQVLFDHVAPDNSKSCHPLESLHVEATEASFHPTSTSTGEQVRLGPGSQAAVCCSHQKQVRFPCDSSISVVHKIVAWDYAYRAARKGPWEEYARNRAHFRRKVDKLALVIEPCLVKKIAAGSTSEHCISR